MEQRSHTLAGRILLAAWFLSCTIPTPAGEPSNKLPIKVFILAGQSNMEGHGIVPLDPARNDGKGSLEYIVKAPPTRERFGHLVDAKGQWVVRNDVQIWYLGRTGGLTVGYGARPDRIGPELQFGHVLGDHYDHPVLLIKLAWGGKSLAQEFRPPSAGGDVGPYYTELLTQTREVLATLGTLFPQWDGRAYELAGFGWHQGWNDRVNQTFNDAYEQNLAHFIRDIRRDLDRPDLPFVIAETGMSGHQETHPRALSLMRAQAAVARYEEFKDNVAFVGTKDFYRPKEVSPSGQAYHWNTNAETYCLIGAAMARALLELQPGTGR